MPAGDRRQRSYIIDGLCLNDGDGEVAPVAQNIVRTFLGTAPGFVAGSDNAAVCERPLLADLIVRPARRVQLREDVFATGVGFGERWHISAASRRMRRFPASDTNPLNCNALRRFGQTGGLSFLEVRFRKILGGAKKRAPRYRYGKGACLVLKAKPYISYA